MRNAGTQRAITVGGQLMDFSKPRIMGILNVTPDSFYAESRKGTDADIAKRVEQIVAEGADILDIGAYSTRQNAAPVTAEEEMARLRKGLAVVRDVAPRFPVSVDTFRADVARMCVEEYGADLINDISAGDLDPGMADTVARLGVPYVMMHMQGTPQDMQANPRYDDVRTEVMQYFARKIQDFRARGVKDLILDPGFGYGKTLAHNYELLSHLDDLQLFGLPILVGVSRKSMIYNLLGITPQEALNGTTAVHTLALDRGADVLRVHDVKACAEAVAIFLQLDSTRITAETPCQ